MSQAIVVPELAEHVELADVAVPALQRRVGGGRDAADDRRHAQLAGCHVEAGGGEGLGDRGDDLVDLVRPGVGDPPATPRRALDELGARSTPSTRSSTYTIERRWRPSPTIGKRPLRTIVKNVV